MLFKFVFFIYFVVQILCDEECELDRCTNRNLSSSLQPNCLCDDECVYYNDCCVDKATSGLIKEHDPRIHIRCNIKVGERKYLGSISKCSRRPWDVNEEFFNKAKKRCELVGLEKRELNLFSFLPVYSLKSNLIYKNIYCSQCYEEKVKDVKFLGIASDFDPDYIANVLNNLVDKEFSEDLLETMQITFTEPNNTNISRYCVKPIDSCPRTSNLTDKCLNGPNQYRYSFMGVVYRNNYCAECNGLNANLTTCSPSAFQRMGSHIRHQNLEVLFDMSNVFEELAQIRLRFRFNNQDVDIFDNETKCVSETGSNRTLCRTYDLEVYSSGKVCTVGPSFLGYRDTYKLQTIKKYITVVGQSISIVSLILLLIMYSSTKLLRNLPGKILICLSVSLVLSQVFFLLGSLVGEPFIGENENCGNKTSTNIFFTSQALLQSTLKVWPCYTFGFLLHYSLLCFFAWSNIMAYDLYTMFMSMSSKNSKSKSKLVRTAESNREDHSKVFVRYLLYGFLAPLLFISLLLLSQLFYKRLIYGFERCFISSQIDSFIFLKLPVIILLLLNAFYLINSIKSIRGVDKISKKYLSNENSRSSRTSSKYSHLVSFSILI